jgi:hypothetical protein
LRAVTLLARAAIERAASCSGAALGEGAFSPGSAVWVGKREIAHVDRDGLLDIRLTRQVIRDRREELRSDPRIGLRSSSSDWLEIRVETEVDLNDALTLIRAAIAANSPTAVAGPPPTGADLERRRRFH